MSTTTIPTPRLDRYVAEILGEDASEDDYRIVANTMRGHLLLLGDHLANLWTVMLDNLPRPLRRLMQWWLEALS